MNINYKVVECKLDDRPWKVYATTSSNALNVQDLQQVQQNKQSEEDGDFVNETSESVLAQSPVAAGSDADISNTATDIDDTVLHTAEPLVLILPDIWSPTVQTSSCAMGTSQAEPEVLHSSDTKIDSTLLERMCDCEPNDPVPFINKRITGDTIDFLINRPCQPSDGYKFPQVNGRSFKSTWFVSIQPNGPSKIRTWLSYSMSSDHAYCLTCLLFGRLTADQGWIMQGFSGWYSGHGLRGIERHESSTSHRQAEVIRYQWLNKCRVDLAVVAKNKAVIEQNRRVMYIAVKTMKFLAKR